MSKKSTITNLIVMPLIASAVFLAGPAFASTGAGTAHMEVRNVTTAGTPNTKKGVAGTVTSKNGDILIITSLEGVQYTVDASAATIMKASSEITDNPAIIEISDIKVGDSIVVRGTIRDTEE